MTVLIGASVLLVAASAIALVFGWANANESLIWTSIAASAGAGIALALAYVQARRQGPASPSPSTASPAEVAAPPAQAASPALTESEGRRPPRREPAAIPEIRPEPVERKEAAPPAKKATARTRPQTPSAARVTSKPRSAPKEPAAEVIALPDSKKYHRPECRYAKSKGAERMTKAAARRRSYSACGICKP